MTQLLPNKTWGTGKRAHPTKYHLSGPPRRLDDPRRDYRELGGHQLEQARRLESRDRDKFLGSKDAAMPGLPEPSLREGHAIPERRPAMWYASKAGQYAQNREFDLAYWYYMKAASIQRLRNSERQRWIDCAKSCQKSWASQRGIS